MAYCVHLMCVIHIVHNLPSVEILFVVLFLTVVEFKVVISCVLLY